MRLTLTLGLVFLMASPALAQGRRGRGGPEVGSEAPNFTAKKMSKDEEIELKKLIDGGDKPIVLIFGSYT